MKLSISIALLFSLAVFFVLILKQWQEQTYFRNIFFGIVFGFITLIGMTTPFIFSEGLILDARSVILGLSGLFGGPIAALISSTMAAAYRLEIGGVGTLTGLISIYISSFIGVVGYYLYKRQNNLTNIKLLLIGFLIHCGVMLAMFTLPDDIQSMVMTTIAFPYLIIFPLIFWLLGKLLLITEAEVENQRLLKESKERLHYALEGSKNGVWDWNIPDNKLFYTTQWKSMLGYTDDEIENTYDAWYQLVHPDDLPKALQDIEAHISGKTKFYENEHRLKHKNGSWVSILSRGKVVRYDDSGNPLRMVGTHTDITVQKKAEAALQNAYNLLKTIINTVPARIFWKDTNLNFLGCNDAFVKDACEESTDDIIGKSDYDFVWKENADSYRADDLSVIESGIPKLAFEEVQKRPDGSTVWLRTSKVPLYDEYNNAMGIVGMYEDITEYKLVEISLRESESHLQAIIENEPECVKLVDAKGNLIEMNPAGLKMLQADTLEEVKKHKLISYVFPQWRAPFIALHKKVMNGYSGTLEFEIQGLKGERRWLETHAVPMRDDNGKVDMFLGITRDITQRKESERHIQYLANFDSLTGLPNRAKLNEQLTYLINLAKRRQNSFSLMFIDVDNFKDINDTLGHDIGDMLLVELSKRLKSILREEDTLARLGGDEFILLLPECDAAGAQKIAQKLLYTIQSPFSIEQYELNITFSIGIALYPTDGLDKETLSKNADAAMYRAKVMGRNGYSFFTEEMQTVSTRKLQLLNALYHALSRNEFYIVYQPQISLNTEHIVGVEALLRWKNPVFGTISPEEFIPIAENSGLILAIGEWVLKSATEQLKSWIDRGMSPIIMSVNLSAVQFRHSTLPNLITQILQSTKLPAKYLELELTESVAMNNPKEAISIMDKLYELGIRMSIDDFGTGYSSLSYLKKFKVNKLKIDQSFVRDIIIDPEDKTIVSAIINMAHSLGLKAIAEGVETAEQLSFLHGHGCDEAQGYYYNKPLLPEEFERIYKDEKYLKPDV